MMRPAISTDNLEANFQEITLPFTKEEAMEEANRCLYCYDAPCTKACPTGIDIPKFIKKIATGNLKGSAFTIMKENAFGASCARVCPTEILCEGACVLNHVSTPIQIGRLQRYATDWAMQHSVNFFNVEQKNGKKVAVIGGGPAGLSAARELALLGYTVTVYEAKEQAGGLNTHGIVSFRLPQEVPLWEVEQIEKLGVEIRTNTNVGQDIPVKEILEQHDAVILAVGMAKVPMLGIKGEDLAGVFDAIELVEETKKPPLRRDFINKRVAVIGAGNTAIDAATTAIRLGAKNVKIIYRRTVEEMSAYPFEYEFAKQDGVEFRWLTQPVEIIGNDKGQVTALKCIQMKLGDKDEYGKRKPIPVENSEFEIEVDIVIKAIGQERYLQFIREMGLEHRDGVVTVDENYQTSNPKVFAAGDVIYEKGQTDAMVVTAVQQGKEVARAVHRQFISGEKRYHALGGDCVG